jgi:hypothetical protein
MSDSDTYLDSILEGLTVGEEPAQAKEKRSAPDVAEEAESNGVEATTASPEAEEAAPAIPPAPEPASELSSLDQILDGMTTSEPTGTTEADTSGNGAVVDLAEVDPEVLIGTGDLDLATPQDILGVPSEPGVVATHIDLAQEINDVAAPATPEVGGDRQRWESNNSFAAMARDISSIVEVDPASSKSRSGDKSGDAEHPSFYVRTKRRRRKRRMNTMTIGQVIAIFLLLVVGLAGEYEYVSKHSGSPITVAPIVSLPKIPVVADTPVPGALFHFVGLGSGDSAPFSVKSRFAIAWTARCARPSDLTGVVITLKSGSRIVGTISVNIPTAAAKSHTTATLAAGTYTVFTHASAGCTWTVTGLPRA